MKTYVIIGATGNTGKLITLGLLEKGHKVRLVSRSAVKAKALVNSPTTNSLNYQAEIFEGDAANPELLTKAFQGADAVYTLVPLSPMAPDFLAYQLTHVNAVSEALKATGVKYAVTLSSVGAHLKSGAGVVQGLQKMEEAINAIPGLNVMHLRATYFMENVLGQVSAVKQMGAMGSPVKGDMLFPIVATKDISAVALNYLLKLDFSGKNVEYVLGPRDVTYNEIASVMGKAIGKPDLKYYTVTYEEGSKAMMQMGMGESVVSRMMEFIKALNEGKVMEETKRNSINTTPTTLEEFAHTFKAVYEM
jgi:uncharacterized protein YbjT (DUF2867 family)